MAKPRTARPVKLFIGLLSGDEDLFMRSRQLLMRLFGPTDQVSDIWPFNQTEYYTSEMGPDLKRQFFGFERLIQPSRLAEIKRETNAIEERIADDCALPDIPRPVNLDPGYLDLGKLVLATTKDRAHRIYVGSGIYAEVTLQYTRGAWQPWSWTYPDYCRPEYHEFFARLRECLRQQQRDSISPGGAREEKAE